MFADSQTSFLPQRLASGQANFEEMGHFAHGSRRGSPRYSLESVPDTLLKVGVESLEGVSGTLLRVGAESLEDVSGTLLKVSAESLESIRRATRREWALRSGGRLP